MDKKKMCLVTVSDSKGWISSYLLPEEVYEDVETRYDVYKASEREDVNTFFKVSSVVDYCMENNVEIVRESNYRGDD